MPRILIAGVTGLVGSEADKFFTGKGWDVVGIDSNQRAAFFGTESKEPPIRMDIRNKVDIDELFEKVKFDVVLNAAAQPSHDYSKDHVMEDFDINARGTLVLLESTRANSPDAVFIQCSTDKIYGDGMKRNDLYEGTEMWEHDWPFDENTPIEPPLSPFGVSKLAADFYVQEYAKQGWLTTGIFRMGCITGRNHAGAEQHGFLAYLAKCIKEGKTYKIFGYKGKQVRDQIHAYDLVNAFWHFINQPRSGEVYNIGGGFPRAVSPLYAGRVMAEKLGKEFKYEIEEEPRFADRQWDVHDISKFHKHYPEWDYTYSLDEILNDLCQP